MFRVFGLCISLVVLSGCSTVQYNQIDRYKMIDNPEVGSVVTAYVGDHMVEKGKIVEEDILRVNQMIDGALYDIPANDYKQVGQDADSYFFSSLGVIRNPFADPFKALQVYKQKPSEVCVVTVLGATSC